MSLLASCPAAQTLHLYCSPATRNQPLLAAAAASAAVHAVLPASGVPAPPGLCPAAAVLSAARPTSTPPRPPLLTAAALAPGQRQDRPQNPLTLKHVGSLTGRNGHRVGSWGGAVFVNGAVSGAGVEA